MNRIKIVAIACAFGLGVAATQLCATDDPTPASGKPATEKPSGDKPSSATDKEKPIKNLHDLMNRMQRQNSEALLASRASDAPRMLAAVKKVEGYFDQVEKWLPDKVSKDEAKKKRFLELTGQVQKSVQESTKLLAASDVKKGSAEYAKANGTCQTCHNEFRPKK
ncbi:MAG: cytochrome c [Planctomycetes bacterium]|nr:cytochrome c [Planctomycetota bacterium]MBI3847733.1 cytochrome c [Planctomycetota bacterium]